MTGPPIRVEAPVIQAGDIRARQERVQRTMEAAEAFRNPPAEVEQPQPDESIGDKFRRLARVTNKIFNPLFGGKETAEDIRAARQEGAGRLQSIVAGFQDEVKLMDQAQLFFDPIGEYLGAEIEEKAAKVNRFQRQIPGHSLLQKTFLKNTSPTEAPEALRTLETIQDIFRGDANPADVAGLLRGKFQERGFRDQLVLGILSDPTFFLTPAAIGKVGGKVSSVFSRQVAKQADDAVRQTFGRSLDELTPVAGGMSAEDVGKLGDIIFNAARDADTTRRFSQAGGEQVQKQVASTKKLMDGLLQNGDATSLQDRAILSLARATGMRIGRITGLSWERLNRGLAQGDLIEAAARGQAKEVGDATGAIRIPEPDLPAVQQAVADYKTARILEGGAVEGDELAFGIGIKAGKTPASERARDAFNLRFKGYQARIPDLPSQTKFFRHLFAKEAYIRGTPIEAIGRQLAHADTATTQRFYLRELGINLTEADDELLEALSGLAPDLVDDAMKFSRAAQATPGGLRKGAAIGKGEQAITVGEIGRRAERQVGISANDATILQKLDGETAGFYDRSARLFALKRVVQRLDRMKGALDAQKQSIKEGLSFKRAPTEVDDLGGLTAADKAALTKSLKEQQAVLNGKEKARAAYAKVLSEHIGREAGDIQFNIRKSAEAGNISADQASMLEDSVLRIQSLASEKAGEKALRFKIVAKERAKIKRTSLIEARAGKSFAGLKADALPGRTNKAVKDWLDNPTVLKTLDERGMHQSLSTAGVRRVLNKLKKFPEALGDDFGQLLETNPKLADERIWQVAATMRADNDLMRRFQFRATNTQRRAAHLEDAVEAGGGQPPREPPTRKTDLGDELPADFDAGERIDLAEHKVPQVQTSERAKAASRAVGQRLGSKVRSIFESTTGGIAGLASFLQEPGRVMAGLNAGYDLATQVGRRTTEAYVIRLRKAGVDFDVRPNFGKPGEGGSYIRFTKESVKVKKIHPGLREALRGSHTEGEMEAFMRDFDMMHQLSPAQVDEFYSMSDEAYDAIVVAPQEVIAKMDRLFEEARTLDGFDINKFLQGRRIEDWHPRMVGSIADAEKMRSIVTDGIRQAQPTFFLERKHKNYWDAIVAGDQYVNGTDALGLYVQTGHMLMLEHQAGNLMKGMAGVLPLHDINTTQRAARSLGRVRDDLTRAAGPTSWEEHGKALELSERHFPELTQRVLDDPLGAAVELDDFVKLAVEDYQTTRALQARQLGADWQKDYIWSAHDWDQIRKLSQPSQAVIFKWAESTLPLSQALRFAKTGFDFGAPLIHGFPVFFDNPKVWARGVRHQFQAFASPQFHREYMNNVENAPIVREMQQHGSTIRTRGEPFEFLSQKQSLGVLGRKLVLKSELGETPTVFERFESAFSGFQDFAQLEMYKALKRDGMGRRELEDLVASVNKMTGTYNSSLSGLTPSTRILQTSLAFAPMYRRAAYGLIMDVGRGGIRRDRAIKALGSMLLGAGFTMWFLGELTGNDEVLDPSSPRFMTAKVGQFNVGVGTAYYSLIRLATSLTEVATNTDVSTGGIESDPEGRARERWKSWPDNQLFRWFRAQASPVAANTSDLALGRTYLGETLRDENGPDWEKMVQHSSSQLLPFWFDREMRPTWMGGKGLRGGPYAAGGEMSGLRSFPQSLVQQSFEIKEGALLASQDPDIVAWRAERAAAGKEASWRAAPVTFKQRLTENNPEVLEIEERLKEADLERGDETQKDFILFREGSAANREQLKVGFANLATSWDTGLLTDREFRNKRSAVLTQHQTRVTSLSDRFPAVIRKFEESRLNKDEDVFVGDLAFDKYVIEVLNHPDTTDELGNFQPDVFARVKQEWRDNNLINENAWDYIQSRLRTKQDLPDVLQEFEDDKESLGAYWDIHHTAMNPREAQIIEMYLSKGDNINQSLFENSHPTVKAAVKKWRKLRLRMRAARPELDWLLAKWYGLKPSTGFALQKFNQRQVQWGRQPIR